MDELVNDIQRGLIERGHDLGRSGPRKDGIDGDLGSRTLSAIHVEIGVPEPISKTIGFQLSSRDMKRLEGVHADLQKIIIRVAELTPERFTVLEGLRSLERQKALLKKGATKTMNSRHLTGHAVDIAPLGDDGNVSWDWPLYHQLSPIVKNAAAELGIPIEWGGDWRSFKDGPHWQLPWAKYPK